MNDTVGNFVQFITDDPLMLGLCIAIGVLVLLFFIVLLSGKKKESKPKAAVSENTTQLLKSEVAEEALRSTQEFKAVSPNEQATMTQSAPVQEQAQVVPEQFEEVVETPVTPSPTSQTPVSEAPKEPIPGPITPMPEVQAVPNEIPAPIEVQTPVSAPVMPKVEPVMPVAPEMPDKTIVMQPVEAPAPVVDADLPHFTGQIPVQNAQVQSAPVAPSAEVSQAQPFSSVYAPGEETKQVANEDFSKTAIIRHVPVMEEAQDDGLPKLSGNDNNSVLNALSGETFNLK